MRLTQLLIILATSTSCALSAPAKVLTKEELVVLEYDTIVNRTREAILSGVLAAERRAVRASVRMSSVVQKVVHDLLRTEDVKREEMSRGVRELSEAALGASVRRQECARAGEAAAAAREALEAAWSGPGAVKAGPGVVKAGSGAARSCLRAVKAKAEALETRLTARAFELRAVGGGALAAANWCRAAPTHRPLPRCLDAVLKESLVAFSALPLRHEPIVDLAEDIFRSRRQLISGCLSVFEEKLSEVRKLKDEIAACR